LLKNAATKRNLVNDSVADVHGPNRNSFVSRYSMRGPPRLNDDDVFSPDENTGKDYDVRGYLGGKVSPSGHKAYHHYSAVSVADK